MKMADLEQIVSGDLWSMDAQNVTSILLSLIIQLGKADRNKQQQVIWKDGSLTQAFVAMLMKHYSSSITVITNNKSALLSIVVANLEREGHRWKEEANRRISHVASKFHRSHRRLRETI